MPKRQFVAFGHRAPNTPRPHKAIILDNVGQWPIDLDFALSQSYYIYEGYTEVNGELVHTFTTAGFHLYR